MNNKNNIQHLINRKTAQVTHAISQHYKITYEESLNRFSFSDTYRKLTEERTKYWRESVTYILESFIHEANGLPISDDY